VLVVAVSLSGDCGVHTDAAIRGLRDDLLGLKESIIISHLIPAGTGMYRYSEVDVESEALPEPEPLPALEPAFDRFLPRGLPEPTAFSFGNDD
jgi:DNA-directed RNA polymerase subunit beta'